MGTYNNLFSDLGKLEKYGFVEVAKSNAKCFFVAGKMMELKLTFCKTDTNKIRFNLK